jgi:hypothetical protein
MLISNQTHPSLHPQVPTIRPRHLPSGPVIARNACHYPSTSADRKASPCAVSHLNLNNLPAEIIQEIASHLRPDWYESQSADSDFSDDDYDDMSVCSVEAEDGPPELKVLPCCRPGDSEASEGESRTPILDDEANFSATSNRIRDIVFDRPQGRRKTIRYCEQWRRETMKISEAVRLRYR